MKGWSGRALIVLLFGALLIGAWADASSGVAWRWFQSEELQPAQVTAFLNRLKVAWRDIPESAKVSCWHAHRCRVWYRAHEEIK